MDTPLQPTQTATPVPPVVNSTGAPAPNPAATPATAPSTGTPAPNPATAVPNTFSSNSQTNPAQSSPLVNTPANKNPGSSLHARVFDGILRSMSGGPVRVLQTDPTTGATRQVEVPQSRSSMAKSIVAAALTGMMTPPVYRNTPYGPARDPQASMASAFKAGADVTAKRQQAAQNLTDSEQARRLMTVQNNANLLQLMTASTHLKHQGLEDLYNSSKEFLSPFETYDTLRDQNAPPAFLNRGMSVDEIFKSGHKLTDANVVLDGIQPSPDGGIP